MKKKLLLVDGMALLFRSFFATAVHRNFMMNDKGVPTNGVHGFLKHLLTAVTAFEPSHVVCCWDMGSKTYRNDLFKDYKANRGEPPLELIPQFDLAKEAARELGVLNIGLAGYEADDCIGTLAALFRHEADVTIVTGDKDLLQVLEDSVQVALMQKGIGNYKVYTKESFIEETGIEPQALIDIKALMGDSSDNYPGVKGIGEKTAYKLIREYSTVDRLLENIDRLTKGQQTKINESLEDLKLSRVLAEIKCDVPLSCSLEDADFTLLHERAREMLKVHQIRGIEPLLMKMEKREIG
ncbi:MULTISPECIES: 5'-3' exonuclease [Bacillus]|uniref:5'-3' exonuclease n=1 Tax=Bacillus glycinifermentans TaxID=1664069 RepID=A0AAJ3YZ15_9BACI|nr:MULTISPECIES: 5'-3' exonuclease [Bacillus]KKB75048.1 5'-3' exonuclease [Bacillus sp. TH008]MBU8784898.1 5'-3' exonuclease [Bacillus glycinifermentans]MDU0071002.1 5'-3' exonuclease [Bacillus sp. IG6]MED8018870.1 5'-3' exonuclease [Bacillus glycinifermentans]NUJ15073.1 5'-3' exonuclease [Bacillus glycinifermentans]